MSGIVDSVGKVRVPCLVFQVCPPPQMLPAPPAADGIAETAKGTSNRRMHQFPPAAGGLY